MTNLIIRYQDGFKCGEMAVMMAGCKAGSTQVKSDLKRPAKFITPEEFTDKWGDVLLPVMKRLADK